MAKLSHCQANNVTDTNEYSPLIAIYTQFAVNLSHNKKCSGVMTFIGQLTTQLYCLLVGAHSEGAQFAVPCTWKSIHLRFMSTLNYVCISCTLDARNP